MAYGIYQCHMVNHGKPIKNPQPDWMPRVFCQVQFVCLWDFERAKTDQDATTLFRDYINPYFRSKNSQQVSWNGLEWAGMGWKMMEDDGNIWKLVILGFYTSNSMYCIYCIFHISH